MVACKYDKAYKVERVPDGSTLIYRLTYKGVYMSCQDKKRI